MTEYPASIYATAAENLARDGAVVIPSALSPRWVDRLRDAIETELNGNSPTGSEFGSQAGRFYGDLFLWLHNPEFRAVAQDSPLPEIAASLMHTKRVRLFYDQLFVKEPGSIEPTPWHQDLPYWPITGEQILSIWIPVDRATPENGVVTYVQGSHRWGRAFRPQAFGNSGNTDAYRDSSFEPMPDLNRDPQQYTFLNWCLDPGDILVHLGLTIHGATGNRSSNARRRALAIRYTGDDALYTPRPGTFMDIEAVRRYVPVPEISAGSPLGGKLFPQVWPRE
jgi:ectoine hydroxylase-related dioxygenase (phytanoyl-CoA dioxygenase family)